MLRSKILPFVTLQATLSDWFSLEASSALHVGARVCQSQMRMKKTKLKLTSLDLVDKFHCKYWEI